MTSRSSGDGEEPDALLGDSAGRPWAGRGFHHHPTAFDGDDGSAPPRLSEAIRRFRLGDLTPVAVLEAIRDSRLLVPLVAEAGDGTQELSIVTVLGPDGRTVLPVFASVAAMRQWDPAARPVPVEGMRVMAAAVDEAAGAVVVDPGGELEYAVRRPALWSAARGLPWVPAYRDPDVLAAFTASVEEEPAVVGLSLDSGDPRAQLAGPEVVVTLALLPGLDRSQLDALTQRLAHGWAADDTIATRVDSLTVRYVRTGV